MTPEMWMHVFGWSALINYAILIVWWLFFWFAHDWMYRLHGQWFSLSLERFDAMHYFLMALFKVAIFIFGLGPYFALRIVL